MKENKIFPWLVTLAAISISFSAAFYSIFGIGKMFAGAATNVMIMAGSLEFAKLVIASFLYRFWNDVNKFLRTYLTIACVVLVMITSAGIYGFLSSAYQETANKVENVDKNSGVLVKQKEMIQRQLTTYEKQLEFKNARQNTLSDMRNRQQSNADNLILQNKSASSVRSQMNQLGKESKDIDADIKIIQDSITSKNTQINDLDLKILAVSTNNGLANEIGPLKYLAKLTGKSIDQVVNWFIIALMIVFDPLAIALVVAANFLFSYTQKPKEDIKIDNKPEPVEEPVEEIIEDDAIVEEPEEPVEEPTEDVIETPSEEENDIHDSIIEEKLDMIEKLEEIKETMEEKIENDELPAEEVKEIEEEIQNVDEIVEKIEEEIKEEIKNPGEFGGYKLGNVYRNQARRDDPTRLK